MNPSAKNKIDSILAKKKQGEKITMLTAYDYPLAALIDQCGIDIILVGDSLANVALGLESTREVGMDIMLHHTKAVRRAVKETLLVGDMPYGSYTNPQQAAKNARRFIEEAGCDAVKLEWSENAWEVTQAIVKKNIPVMGHVGLTPQSVEAGSEFKVQGKNVQSARNIIEQAKQLERCGCFSVVLECIPDRVADLITQNLSIPTVGIGAGALCDGQVLVTHDLLGLFERFHPKFTKQYTNLSETIRTAVRQFRQEVLDVKFPDKEHSFIMPEDQWRQLNKGENL